MNKDQADKLFELAKNLLFSRGSTTVGGRVEVDGLCLLALSKMVLSITKEEGK